MLKGNAVRLRAASGAALLALLTGVAAGFAAVGGATGAVAAADNESCRPDGLYRTPGVDVPYCLTYDGEGREKMGADHARRIIGYFTGWRDGGNGQTRYLASDIPWGKVTHINYAFAHVGADNKISVGSNRPENAAIGMTWPGVAGAEMDPAYSYKGHFNLLSKFKKQYPNTKTLVSVGGWAETGGYFDDSGKRQASGGFYTMTASQASIDTFADSVVSFLRTYGFNGVDIDYEYATSNKDAGNPLDWPIANGKRGTLMKGYVALMKTLREKLDRASAADGRYYMLTVAAPASGWLLRGMETYQVTQYLDYLNIMSYDLHGAWNQYVGPNASLYDDGKDGELAAGGVYGAGQYGGIGYLNTDWAYHYFRGAMQPGRINIGLPYYTRGFKNVNGGTNGLWGTAPGTTCPAGSGLTSCGDGAVGIDNLWHDLDDNGKESPAGSNPMWHAKNLEKGILGDYLASYGLGDATLTGTYTRNYSSTLTAPWLWNSTKRVFLSTEDEQSVGAKADYVIDKGLGGTMIWELAGDYGWNAAKGQYEPGTTLTTLMYDKFKTATPYTNVRATTAIPAQKLDLSVEFRDFALGDNNYPINPKIHITNKSSMTLPGGTEFQFDYASSAPGTASDQSGFGMTVIRKDHNAPNNVGGLKGDYNRVSFKLPSWQTLAPGGSVDLAFVYQLPTSTPSNWTVTFGGNSYGILQDLARGGTVASPSPSPSSSPGGPSPSPSGTPCAAAPWSATTVYTGGNLVSHNGHTWRAKWWTQGDTPGTAGVWEDRGTCGNDNPSPSPSPSASPSPSPSPSASPSPSPSPSPSSPGGDNPAWKAGTSYTAGAKVSYGGSNYQCLQAHTALAGWEPPNVAALWKKL
ncbi:chitinase C-terminal domain-containing protein [Sphaerimonospora thailandensis]|uniref:Chitinase n=1 Tax=Sphaerimonospora thailandensis TaxID=795644 RepID=A0A8J3R8I8_9ACTN|nr:glycosyl hydrolase family 18 protein [Sphaerimonospora thailandensis]GIH69354.1 chitinase [Sphaerimonospora thailandensis]